MLHHPDRTALPTASTSSSSTSTSDRGTDHLASPIAADPMSYPEPPAAGASFPGALPNSCTSAQWVASVRLATPSFR